MDVYRDLCTYDKRNPEHLDYEDPEKPKDCSCDNCFHGADRLAKEIIRLEEKIALHKQTKDCIIGVLVIFAFNWLINLIP